MADAQGNYLIASSIKGGGGPGGVVCWCERAMCTEMWNTLAFTSFLCNKCTILANQHLNFLQNRKMNQYSAVKKSKIISLDLIES